MAQVCPFFEKLYRLFDLEKDQAIPVTPKDLRSLVDLCNFCGLCPCPEIRAKTLKAKSSFIQRDGMSWQIKQIQDVEKLGWYLNRFKNLSSILIKSRLSSTVIKKIGGIHSDRVLPPAPGQIFASLEKNMGLWEKLKDHDSNKNKVAYFAGCTSKYFYPEVAVSTVRVLQKNKVQVYLPPQKCCSMPTLLEGDTSFTRKLMAFNLDQMADAVEHGFEPVCSCPTCGYMFKKLLQEKACYSLEYQKQAGGDETFMVIPVENMASQQGNTKFRRVHKAMYSGILKDDGVFSILSPVKRIAVAGKTFDLGQYLKGLLKKGRLNTEFFGMDKTIAYYPPCHTREQNMGLPYIDLLNLIPGIDVQVVKGSYLCCGMGGIMGCKKDFHSKSIEMAQPLLQKIREINPDILVTECLSCRLQFKQTLPFSQAHPAEILSSAYGYS